MFFEIFFGVLAALTVYSVIACAICFSSAFKKFMMKKLMGDITDSVSTESDEEEF